MLRLGMRSLNKNPPISMGGLLFITTAVFYAINSMFTGMMGTELLKIKGGAIPGQCIVPGINNLDGP